MEHFIQKFERRLLTTSINAFSNLFIIGNWEELYIIVDTNIAFEHIDSFYYSLRL